MKASEFADFSQILANLNDYECEAMFRTQISRWYYAIFHQVQNWLVQNFMENFNQAVGNSHERLAFCCHDLQRIHKDLLFSKLGRLLNEIKQQRVIADYYLNQTVKKYDAENTKATYDEIITVLQQLQTKYEKKYE